MLQAWASLLSLVQQLIFVSDVIGTTSDEPNPDLSNRRESCPKEGCPDGDRQNNVTLPLAAKGEGLDGISADLAEIPEGDPAWWNLLSKAKAELTRVTGTLHDTLNTITSRFADTIREILNKELYDIIAALLKKVEYIMFKPGE